MWRRVATSNPQTVAPLARRSAWAPSRVTLSSGESNKVRLVVSDDGAGFPKSLDFRHTQSLGLQLVNTLTEQLPGTIEMRLDAGTSFQIEFPR